MAALIADDIGVRVDGEDAIANRPVAHGRLPDGAQIEEIAVFAKGAEFLLAVADVEFRGGNKAAIVGKTFPFRPDELIGNAIGKARVGTPGRFNHLNFSGIVRVASDDGTATSESVGVERSCFRVHDENI